jgi:hypothetical protein
VDDQQRRRRVRREFIRAGHPDRGGDPAAFAAGLAELTQVRVPPVRVALVPERPLVLGLLRGLARGISRRRPPPRVR